ncbi:MAG TPA: phospholipid carrier-dependent glycosyltransferase [Candidatus Binatia bacterium]
MSSGRRRVGLVLVGLAIAVLAIAARYWRLRWGLTLGMAFTDELQMWPSYLNAFVPLRPESFLRADQPGAMIYPAFYGFLSGLAVAVAHGLGLMAAPQADVFSALYMARLVAATASTLNVLAVFVLGWRAFSPQVGLLAAAFMAVVPMEAMQTHYASPDPLLELCVTLALIAVCELARAQGRVRIALALAAGAASGLAFSAKYTGLVVLGSCFWALLEIAWRERSVRPLLATVPAALGGFVVAVAIACPPCVLQTDLMLRAMAFLRGTSRPEHLFFWNVHLLPSLGWWGRPYVYQLVAGFTFSLGWPLYLATLGGLAYALRRWTVVDRILLVTAAAYFFSIGTSFVLEAWRYYLPLFPIFTVLAARALTALPWRVPRVALAVLIVAYSTALTFSQVSRFSYDQQHAVARWIRSELGRDPSKPVRVGFPKGMYPYFNLRQPLIWAGLQPWPMEPEEWFDERLDAFVMPEWLAIRIRRDADKPDAMRALDELESGRGGWVPAASWRSGYLQDGFYTALDPLFAADLTQGEIGFTVYVPRR